MKKILLFAACMSGPWLASQALAKVSVEEASQLGTNLTLVGAEKAGNEAGTIPAFSGKIPHFPESVYQNPGKHLPNPYADESPLIVLTAENYKAHSDKLTAGQIAQFEKYPQTYRMKIYPTHRDGVYDARVGKNALKNATEAELVSGGDGITGAFGGPPFPMPKTGQEVIWNQLVRTEGYFMDTTYDGAAVYAKGNRLKTRTRIQRVAPYVDVTGNADSFSGIIGYQILRTLLPKRQAGDVVLVHEPLNQVETPRSAWSYMPSTRRVRRAPVIAYDYQVSPGGLIYADEGRLFNGALDRYDWKLLDKQEKYIPYNNYDMDNPELSYDELLTKKHINPEYMRYELHRVWVVEATLKEGSRHALAKRVMYFDEDSWNLQLVDGYDKQGMLWHTGMQTLVIDPFMPGPIGRISVMNDLSSGDYAVESLLNESADIQRFDLKPMHIEAFTPQGIRRSVSR
ncbi:MAG: DUF1329 domain-containing protein [Pseudomonadales bacterium]|nr:DUF1329 domain-containing protein [Pseudomonadales bacterium]